MFLLKKHRKIASKKTAFTLRFAVFSFLLWFPLKSFLPAFSLRLMFTRLFSCIFFEKSPQKILMLILTKETYSLDFSYLFTTILSYKLVNIQYHLLLYNLLYELYMV